MSGDEDIPSQLASGSPNRIADSDALNQNVPAADKLDKAGPDKVTRPHPTLFNRDLLVPQFNQTRGMCRVRLYPQWPLTLRRLAIQRAFAGDGNVLLFECIYERGVIHHLGHASSENHWQVSLCVRAETNRRVFLEMQIDVAEQVNCTRGIDTRRDNDLTASGAMAGVDRLFES